MRRGFRLAVSGACAALSALLFVGYARDVRAEAQRVRLDALERYGGEVVTLAVARTALEPGDVVSTSNVTMREWLADLAPDGAQTSFDEIVGKEVVAPLSKGAPLTDVTFRSASEVTDVPSGCVAVTLPLTDKLGIPRSVAAGSVLAAYVVSTDGAVLISEGMVVLASPGATSALGSTPQMTVAVASADAPALLSAAATNDLRLVMPAKDVGEGALGPASVAPEELDATEVATPEVASDGEGVGAHEVETDEGGTEASEVGAGEAEG